MGKIDGKNRGKCPMDIPSIVDIYNLNMGFLGDSCR